MAVVCRSWIEPLVAFSVCLASHGTSCGGLSLLFNSSVHLLCGSSWEEYIFVF
jgi:hypothetical protein